jgi:hypothetical protein
MHYQDVKDTEPSDFKRLTGVRKETFYGMVQALSEHLPDFGRPPKLSREDRLLMTLMYWREYRTQFHIAQTYGVSEATVCRTVRKVEDALLKSKQFRLPGKKGLRPSETLIEVVLVDATECSVERPKQTANRPPATAERRSGIRSKRK